MLLSCGLLNGFAFLRLCHSIGLNKGFELSKGALSVDSELSIGAATGIYTETISKKSVYCCILLRTGNM